MPRSRKSSQTYIKPEVIKWAISQSGWDQDELRDKLKLSEDAIPEWMSGDSSPTLRQLESLSKVLKRPLAVFFLSEPPTERPNPPDFRMLPDRMDVFKKETLLALRRARRYQRISRELLQNTEGSLEPTVTFCTVTDDPHRVARRARVDIGLSSDSPKEWKDSYEAFRTLRKKLEDKNIFVFQIKMPMDDARGFVLMDDLPAVIVANASDSIEARVFTLAHEYAHVLLNQSSINMSGSRLLLGDSNRAERWCNEFASELLLPKQVLAKELQSLSGSVLDYDVLSRISRRYKVSKSMLAYKLLRIGAISRRDYTELMDNLESAGIKKPEDSFGAMSQEDRCFREKGGKYVSLVSRNVEKGTIGYHDAMDYLSVNLANVDKVLTKAER